MAVQTASAAGPATPAGAAPVEQRTFVWLAGGAAAYLAVVVTYWSVSPTVDAYRFGTVAIMVAELASICVCLWSGRRHRGAERAWRLLFALALAGALYGQAVWTWYIYVDDLLVPRLSLWTAWYLLLAAVTLAALVTFPTTAPPPGSVARPPAELARWRWLAVLDALIIVCSLLMLAWATALGSVVNAGISGQQFGLSVAYSVSSVVLVIFVLLMAVLRVAGNPRALLLIGMGLVAVAVSTSAFTYLVLEGGPRVTAFVHIGLVAGPLLIALGTVVPAPRRPPAPAAEPQQPEDLPACPDGESEPGPGKGTAERRARWEVWGLSGLPYLPLVGLVALVGTQYAVGDSIGVAEVWLGLVVLALVVIRQVFTLVENNLLLGRVRLAQTELVRQAFTDSLTGLANRAYFSRCLASTVAAYRARPFPLALLFCDVDDFKQVNDAHGHDIGDELLIALGQRLRHCVRAGDTVARLGGDEFAILLTDRPSAGDQADPNEIGGRILGALDQPFTLDGRQIRARISVGLVVADGSDDADLTPEDLLRRGDAAMYAAKRRGKGRLETYRRTLAHPGRTDTIVSDLEFALAGDASAGVVEVHYQPIVSLRDGRTWAYEALVRWTHPSRGRVPPATFVPLAENAGLAAMLDSHVLEIACRDLARLRERGGPHVAVHVNVSAEWAGQADLADAVVGALDRHGVDPAGLVLELTETYRIDDLSAAAAVMGRLTRYGVGLALDDIGAGYSSLMSLHVLPFSVVKLDASLTGSGMPSKTLAVRDGVVTLARALGLDVVAEGVIDPGQAAALARAGCQFGQGWLYGPAVPVDEVPGRPGSVRAAG